VNQRREPIFNVPAAVIALVVVCVLVHLARVYLLTDDEDEQFLRMFAFIPARYDAARAAAGPFPGGWAADLWTFVTYAFIHGSVTHLAVNSVWLLPFGAAVARRFGAIRFLAFFAVTAAAGAAAHLLTADEPMVGASAAISGCMAASTRFAFRRGGPLDPARGPDAEPYQMPAMPLTVALRDRRIIVFIGAWLGLNLLFGLGAAALVGLDEKIAWQAHIGGFLAGLLLFSLFDPVAAPQQLDGSPGEERPPTLH